MPVICNVILNTKNHSEFKEKGTEHFTDVNIMSSLKARNCLLQFFKLEMKKRNSEVSYRVGYHIALAGELHTIAESLIKLCRVDIAEFLLDEKPVKEITAVPLSNDTVTLQINDLAANRKTELILITHLQNWTFVL